MSLAALPMYDFPELRWATDALWAAIAARIKGAPERLERGRDLMDIWTDPDLLLGQTCGYPLVTSLAGKVQLVAVPRYRAESCAGIMYRSAIVVRAVDNVSCLADLRGRRCAVNSLDSNSGMNVLRAAIAPLAVEGRFFGKVVLTGAHAASVAAVARGNADVAAIDCVTWAQLQRLRPAVTVGVRVVDWTMQSPGLPLITSVRTAAATVDALVYALGEVAADAALAPVREALLLEEFEVVPVGLYAAIRELQQNATAAGYPLLQ